MKKLLIPSLILLLMGSLIFNFMQYQRYLYLELYFYAQIFHQSEFAINLFDPDFKAGCIKNAGQSKYEEFLAERMHHYQLLSTWAQKRMAARSKTYERMHIKERNLYKTENDLYGY